MKDRKGDTHHVDLKAHVDTIQRLQTEVTLLSTSLGSFLFDSWIDIDMYDEFHAGFNEQLGELEKENSRLRNQNQRATGTSSAPPDSAAVCFTFFFTNFYLNYHTQEHSQFS